MQIFVRGFDELEALEVTENHTVQHIKNELSSRKGVDCNDLILNSDGVVLPNDALVGSLSSFELDVTCPLLGGKVHGSLARAGKVKGQTPKVEKQEKKKKKTGRAKRRIQYNRRFVNSVQPFGRRRGPNANSS
uniref:Putative ribosomal protein s30 isoform a n=1 Tax=Tabanus bromius TaxID=304241 RepID=A0A0K8TPN3_TABBR